MPRVQRVLDSALSIAVQIN